MSKLVVSTIVWTRRAIICSVALALFGACGERPRRAVVEGDTPTPPLTPLMGAEVLVGAGDIASCASKGDEATAALLDRIPGTVFTAGDNVYPNGTVDRYRRCYEPSWGRHRGRTYPTAGNHDYRVSRGAAYYDYFGARAGPRGQGYYTFTLGDWLIVMLNTNIATAGGSEQAAWLRGVLAGRAGKCEIVIGHHPRFSSGPHGSDRRMASLWRILYDGGVEMMLSGHEHFYERFAPMNAAGALDQARGVRQFIVGTGGFKPYAPRERQPQSERRRTATGVFKLSLGDGVYQWEFVPVAGQTFRDWGEGKCR
jgi:3',5'-cyclic AMP phosphodiesterase CpdA